MGLFDSEAIGPQNPQDDKPHSDIIINQLRTLSLHSKLALSACISLLSKDNNAKVTVTDIFEKYKKLATELNTNWLSMGKITEHIKELEMLGFLKCTYPHKGRGQIKYIRIFEAAEIPKYITVLQEDLGMDIGKIQS